MQDSIFTKIINGDIPSERIYEDEISIVILTIEPLTEGHMLVIPKVQLDSLWDLDDEIYHYLWDIARRMAHRLEQVYDYERIGTIVEGFGVPHAHIHVFGYEQVLNPTVMKQMNEGRQATSEELAVVAEKLRG